MEIAIQDIRFTMANISERKIHVCHKFLLSASCNRNAASSSSFTENTASLFLLTDRRHLTSKNRTCSGCIPYFDVGMAHRLALPIKKDMDPLNRLLKPSGNLCWSYILKRVDVPIKMGDFRHIPKVHCRYEVQCYQYLGFGCRRSWRGHVAVLFWVLMLGGHQNRVQSQTRPQSPLGCLN